MTSPQEDRPHQPHDKLFKQTFSDAETAAGFLSAYLPKRIAEAVDWSALKLQPGSFIDSQFRSSQTDLLFQAPLAGSEAYFYCLFEHQTNEDRALALRLLRYMVRIWEARLSSAAPQTPLPVILPLVLAQSAETWSLKPTFSELFDLPRSLETDLRPFIPDFMFRLIELAQLPFEGIYGTPAGIMVLRAMKAERSGEMLSDAVWDESLLRQVTSEVFEMLMQYIMFADVDSEAIEAKVSSIKASELRETAMSYAQKLRQEGLSQGLSQGRLASLRENVIDALEVRFDSVPAGLREVIEQQGDEAKLRQVHRHAIQCASIEAFTDAL